MTELSGSGISVDLPAGWGGQIRAESVKQLTPAGADPPVVVRAPTVVHIGNFPLPVDRGEFGAGVVEVMQTQDVFMVLFEYESSSAGTGLFRYRGSPGPVTAGDFDQNQLQRGIPGQSGLQLFFSEAGRAFCWYVVVASHLDRADAMPFINHVLRSLVVER